MQLLTAPEAISPALNRTASLLFRPFRWGTFLKLCAVAVLTEGASGNFNMNHSSHHTRAPVAPHVFTALPAGFIPLLILSGVFALMAAIALFYLMVRLRFALFECLIHQTRCLRAGWRRYRDQAWRFFLFSIVIGIAFLVIVVAALAPFLSGIIHLIRESQAASHVDIGAMLGLILQLLPVIMGLALLGIALDVVTRDFMLPHFALENASAGEAWGAVWDRVVAEKGAFVLYAVLRILLPILAMIGIFILMIIPMVIVFGSVGVFTAMLHASAAGASPIGTFFQVVAGLVMVVAGLLLAICFGGPLSIAIRNYALVFYGARYRPIGDVLYPPMPPAAAPGPA